MTEPPDRREYFRAYYQRNREKRLAQMKIYNARRKALRGPKPRRPRMSHEEMLAHKRAYAARNRLALKVKYYWGCRIAEARAWLERGTLPP